MNIKIQSHKNILIVDDTKVPISLFTELTGLDINWHTRNGKELLLTKENNKFILIERPPLVVGGLYKDITKKVIYTCVHSSEKEGILVSNNKSKTIKHVNYDYDFLDEYKIIK